MKKGLLLIATLGLSSALMAKPDAPVTQGEAYNVFAKAVAMLNTVLEMNLAPPVAKPAQPKQPVTRVQVVESLNRLFESVKPKFKFTPRPVQFDKKRLNMKDATANQHLQRLISYGFVAPVGPLATGPKDTVSVEEFGDALGFYMARLAEVTHLPDSKWSPGYTDDRVDKPHKSGG